MVKCDWCGRFMRCETGASWVMLYSGYPPTPDREVFRCKGCTEDHGPLTAQPGIRSTEAGLFARDFEALDL